MLFEIGSYEFDDTLNINIGFQNERISSSW